jgi:hypothetical protein
MLTALERRVIQLFYCILESDNVLECNCCESRITPGHAGWVFHRSLFDLKKSKCNRSASWAKWRLYSIGTLLLYRLGQKMSPWHKFCEGTRPSRESWLVCSHFFARQWIKRPTSLSKSTSGCGSLWVIVTVYQPRSRRLAPAHLIDGISSVWNRAPASVARSRSEARGFTRLTVYVWKSILTKSTFLYSVCVPMYHTDPCRIAGVFCLKNLLSTGHIALIHMRIAASPGGSQSEPLNRQRRASRQLLFVDENALVWLVTSKLASKNNTLSLSTLCRPIWATACHASEVQQLFSTRFLSDVHVSWGQSA